MADCGDGMTASIQDRRSNPRHKQKYVHLDLAADLDIALLADHPESAPWSWPAAVYRRKPVAFCRETLGIEPWDRQIEILEAVLDHDRVAVRAGRKVSKSCTAAIVALWWFCSWSDACVVMTSTTARQVEKILWLEVRKMHARSQAPITADDPGLLRNSALTTRAVDGEPRGLARSGLTSGFRTVSGFTAQEGVGAAGTSGAHLLFILDEASGIPQEIFDAIIGNLAGGGKLLLTGNPTRSEGEFFDAFGPKKATPQDPDGYHCLTISSEESPNVITGEGAIPGLATRAWIKQREREWGRSSALFKVHVLGQPVQHEEGKAISLHLLKQAEERWLETNGRGQGRLVIALDPAGPGTAGDESVFAIRRGFVVEELIAFTGVDEHGLVAHLRGIIAQRALRSEKPLVLVDQSGPVGQRVYGAIALYHMTHQDEFDLVGVDSGMSACRDPQHYDRMRDEMWANAAAWLADGSLPEDVRLEVELHTPDWRQNPAGKLKITRKEDMKAVLKRSPDRADAVVLSVWDQGSWSPPSNDPEPPAERETTPTMDPYSAMNVWR